MVQGAVGLLAFEFDVDIDPMHYFLEFRGVVKLWEVHNRVFKYILDDG